MVKRFCLTVAVVFVGFISRAQAFRCDDLFRTVPVEKAEIARELQAIGLERFSYVTKWQVKKPEHAGPFPLSGELLVSGVVGSKFDAWMESVGSRTVGLMVKGLPEMNPGTAALRVGRKYYSFMSVQVAVSPSIMKEARGFSEITIAVSPREMAAIEDFIRARGAQEILAKHDIRKGPAAGQPIRPGFDSEGFTLVRESCAAACTSWMDPKWLKHYEGENAEILRQLAVRLGLRPTHVAKQMIWGHARNPNVLGITLFGIDRPTGQGTILVHGKAKKVDLKDLTTNFIQDNAWLSLRGMPVYGFIPDPKSGDTETIRSQRLTLTEWLN